MDESYEESYQLLKRAGESDADPRVRGVLKHMADMMQVMKAEQSAHAEEIEFLTAKAEAAEQAMREYQPQVEAVMASEIAKRITAERRAEAATVEKAQVAKSATDAALVKGIEAVTVALTTAMKQIAEDRVELMCQAHLRTKNARGQSVVKSAREHQHFEVFNKNGVRIATCETRSDAINLVRSMMQIERMGGQGWSNLPEEKNPGKPVGFPFEGRVFGNKGPKVVADDDAE